MSALAQPGALESDLFTSSRRFWWSPPAVGLQHPSLMSRFLHPVYFKVTSRIEPHVFGADY